MADVVAAAGVTGQYNTFLTQVRYCNINAARLRKNTPGAC